MARAVVFGYGNPLRSDDAVGWRVAEAIARQWSACRVHVRLGHQLLPEWSADLCGASVAYFVDASLFGRRVRMCRVRMSADDALVDGHVIGPRELLRLTSDVYRVEPEAFLLHVPGVNFDFGETLSTRAAGGVRTAVKVLNRRLSAMQRTPSA